MASFAAVTLQFDVRERLVLAEVAAPPGEGDGERGQQHVVDARVEPGGDLAQQRGGDVGADREGRGAFPGDGVGRGQRAPAQRRVGPRQRAPVVGEVGVEPRAPQQLRPAPERRAHRGQVDRRARDVPAPRRGEVLHQDPPGHAVDHHVVGDEDQLARLAAPDGAQHHAAVRVQPVGGERDALVERAVALLPSRYGPVRLRDLEAPALAPHQLGAQHVVPCDHGGEDGVEGVGRQVRRGVQHHRLHEAVDGVRGRAEPLHDRRSHDRAGGDVAVVHGGGLAVRDRRQRAHDAVGEDLAGRDVEARLAQGAQQGDRQDAVSAELEEVLVDADRVTPQHRRDRRAHQALVLGDGRGEHARAGRGLRQRGPVELAVRGERELLHHDDVGGHHVLHHVPGGPLLDLVGAQVLAPGGGDHVAHEVGAAGRVLLRDDAGVAYRGVLGEADLDVLDLQPHTADLDLVVGAAEEVQGSVGGEAGEVPGAVQPGSVRGEGVRDEPGGRQAGGADVSAPEQEPSDVQLAADPDRNRAQFVVQDVQLGVGVGLADRCRQTFRGAPVDDVRDADRRLGRAVAVVHGYVEPGAEALVQLRGQHLAAAPHVPQAVEAS